MELNHSPSDKEKNTVLIRVFGWILLIAGLIMIGWTLLSSYNIFTGGKAVPEFFKIEAKDTSVTVQEVTPATPEGIQKEIEKKIEEQLKEVLPADFLAGILNLTAWSILAFILIFGGAQISGIGIKLIKK